MRRHSARAHLTTRSSVIYVIAYVKNIVRKRHRKIGEDVGSNPEAFCQKNLAQDLLLVQKTKWKSTQVRICAQVKYRNYVHMRTYAWV